MINLSIPNKILNQLSGQNKYITPVAVSDLPLFQRFFKKEKCTYGNSWTYVTQGVYGLGPHNLGYKYYDGKNLSIIGIYPKLEKPELNVFYWVRPMGPTVLDVITDISGQLLAKDSLPTYVKKIFKEQFDYLQKKGFKDTKNFPWYSSCPSEDDSWPEQIIDINKTLLLLTSPPRTSNIRKCYRKATSLDNKNVVLESTDNFENLAWKITKDFFKSKAIINRKINVSNEYDYFNQIFILIKDNKNLFLKKIFYVNKIPLGFYIAEKIDAQYFSLYALIVLRDKIQNISDYMMFKLLKECQTNYLNLGGSEDSGIHAFKQKFKPAIENKMYWATNYSL